jgi:PKD repeat protein
MKTKYLNSGLVICLVLGTLLTAYPVKAAVTPWPVMDFWNYPYDPSTYDWISFGLYDETPTEWTCHWDFGDGSTFDQCWVNSVKRFNADGDYTVSVQVTNGEGERSSFSKVISVRTHDVAIAKFTVPQSARVNQTRQLVVSVNNRRYPENVQVELYKITPNGDVWVGTLKQLVPVRPSNRTTPFSFNYTFTAEDALNGKVTFHAMAFILDAREAWPADNEIISLPTRVSR